MIRLAQREDIAAFPTDYYGGRADAALRAYGTGYDFCRFYRAGRGMILLFNSSAVLCGDIEDITEAEEFINLYAPDTIECPPEISAGLSLPLYERRKRLCFKTLPQMPPENFSRDVSSPGCLKSMYGIIFASFGETDFGLWYTDMSHRIRHNISQAYIYKNISCAAVDFVRGGKAYISQVATLPENRGNGWGRSLLGYVSSLLSEKGISSFLWAYTELEGFYRSLSFKQTGEDTVFIRR